MSKYKSVNPFEDDEDDFVMVKNNSSGGKTNHSYSSGPNNRGLYSHQGNEWNQSGDVSNPFDDRLHNLQRQIDSSENSQLESTQRALASIYDSEAMGVATAEELIHQGETLDSIEKKNAGIQNALKTSQRHLNSIKSVFGGIKNWWKGEKNTAEEETGSSVARTRLRETVEKNEQQVDRPRGDYSGFYDDDRVLDAKFMAKAPKSSGGYSMISPVTRSAREEELDNNLAMMSDGMGRLKGLAAGLGAEIEQQNEQLDRVNLKVADTVDLVVNQNSQMRRILKK